MLAFITFLVTIGLVIAAVAFSNSISELFEFKRTVSLRFENTERLLNSLRREISNIKELIGGINTDNIQKEKKQDIKSQEKDILELIEDTKEIKREIKKNIEAPKTPIPHNDEPRVQNVSNSEIKKEINEEIKQEKNETVYKSYLDLDEQKTPKLKKTIEKQGFDQFMFGNVFNIIGTIAMVIAAFIFFRMLAPYIHLTPQIKVFMGYLVGILSCVGAAVQYKNPKMDKFASFLMGTGFAVLFITTFCAVILFNLFNLIAISFIVLALFLAAYIIASKYKSTVTVIVALAAAYLNPIFIKGYNVEHNILYGYLILVNLISIIFVFVNPKKIAINYVNLIISAIYSFYLLSLGKVSPYFPIALWFLYIVHDLTLCLKDSEFKKDNFILNIINYGVFTLSTLISMQGKSYLVSACAVLSIGIAYLLCSCLILSFSKNVENRHIYNHGAILSILIATYLFFIENREYIVMTWAVEAFVIALIYNSTKISYLQKWAMTALFMSTAGIFFVRNLFVVSDLAEYIPFVNFKAVMFLTVVLVAFLISKLWKDEFKNSALAAKFIYITLIYLFMGIELNLAILKSKADVLDTNSISYLRTFTNTIMLSVYSVQFQRSSNALKVPFFGVVSYGALILSLMGLFHLTLTMPEQLYIPAFNIRTFAYMFAIASALVFKYYNRELPFDFLALLLGLFFFTSEGFGITKHYHLQSSAIVTVFWILYSGVISIAGLFTKIKILKYFGAFVIFLSVLKIIFVDLVGVDPMLKLSAYVILGVISMFVSYIYSKYLKN